MKKEELKEWRKREGLSQQEAADHIGVHYSTYFKWEDGQRKKIPATVEQIIKLKKVEKKDQEKEIKLE